MRQSIRTAAIAAATAAFVFEFASAGSVARAQIVEADRPIRGQYIVVLQESAELSAFRAPSAEQVSSDLVRAHGGRIEKQFRSALRGFSLAAGRATAEALAVDPRVAFVAEDSWVSLAAEQNPVPSWGLDRIDQREPALDDTYLYEEDGSGIDVYVVDTGIRSTHQDFGTRVDVANGFTAIADGRGTEDCNGHGTHVAGVIGGSTYGVAKGVTLHPVRVVDCNGLGPVSNMVAGIDWIASRYDGSAATRAVVNMSVRAGYSYPLEQAVLAAIAKGITFVAAAGNDNESACYLSPGRLPEVITVGASTSANSRWASSNFGACVDLFAPGAGIVSAFATGDDVAIPMTGTSAAAPHVAARAALLLAGNPELSPADIEALITAEATADALTDVGDESPNRLLYSSAAEPQVDLAPVASFDYYRNRNAHIFDASASTDDHGIVGYDWDFGDGTQGDGMVVSHQFRPVPGQKGRTYEVTLTVTDSVGQVSTQVRTVQVSGN